MRGRSGPRASLVLGAVVLLVLAGLVVWRVRAPGRIGFVGDSITDQARPLIEQRFGAAGDDVRAVGGSRIEDMMPASAALAATEPPQVVIDLGTNDVLANEPAEPNGVALTQMVEQFSTATCVHLVTINEHMLSPSFGNVGTAAVALNQQIAVLARTHPTVRVVDWDRTVLDYDAAGDPNGPITVDTVHPSPMGQQMLFDAVQRSIDSC